MTTHDKYGQGTPCWADLQTTDQEGAKAFYGGLFGWSFDDQPTPQGATYSMGRIDGRSVAAIAPQTAEMAAQGVPPTWNVYLAVDDVDATTAAVAAAGGTVAMEPFDVMDAGRMSFVADPSGAFVGLWQAGRHIGSELTNVPGAITWNELITTDAGAALPFYDTVLGLRSETVPFGPGFSYTMFVVDGRQVGGSTPPQAEGVPNHWNVWFATADADATAARATELGGTVLVAPMDMPVGRMCVIRDPQGGVINVMQPGDQGDAPA
jgi:predicted enzyme related to lactoylglutathione lyase